MWATQHPGSSAARRRRYTSLPRASLPRRPDPGPTDAAAARPAMRRAQYQHLPQGIMPATHRAVSLVMGGRRVIDEAIAVAARPSISLRMPRQTGCGPSGSLYEVDGEGPRCCASSARARCRSRCHARRYGEQPRAALHGSQVGQSQRPEGYHHVGLKGFAARCHTRPVAHANGAGVV